MHIDVLLAIASLILLITVAVGLARAMIGNSLEDRMLSVQLLGTGGVGLLLLLSFVLSAPALLDVALVLALLSAVAAAALTRRKTDHA